MPTKKTATKTSTTDAKGSAEARESATGKYIFDKKLNKVVKVSDKVPGLKKSGGSGDFDPSACNTGTCNPGMGGYPGMGGGDGHRDEP